MPPENEVAVTASPQVGSADQPAPASRSAPQAALNRKAKIRRVATLLIMLGPELAAEMLKVFEAGDVREISAEIARTEMVDFKTQQQVLEQFAAITVDAVTSVRGGSAFTRNVLEKSMGAFQANEIIQGVAPRRVATIETAFLQELAPQQLYSRLKSEDPQAIALVLSYLDPIRCGEVLEFFDSNFRADIVARVATMEAVSLDVLSKVLSALKKRTGTEHALSSKPGGLKAIAEVINFMDNAASRSLLETLEEKNSTLATALKKILFTFEDLAKLDRLTLQRILREVESRDLALSLKTASEELQQGLYGALPKRAGENIREDIKLMGPVRLRDIEAAQDRIIDIMRKLEGEGEIVISMGGKEDMVL